MTKAFRILLLQLSLLLVFAVAHAVPGVTFYSTTGPAGGSASTLAVDAAGNSYVTGTTSPFAGVFVTKLSPTGAVVWTRTYGADAEAGASRGISVTENGDVYIGGTISNGGQLDGLIVKYDKDGVFQWDAFFNGLSSSDDEFFAIGADEFGSVYATGYVDSGPATDLDMVTAKFDSDGNFQWAKSFDRSDGVGFSSDVGLVLRLDTSGNVIVSGNTDYIDFNTQTDHQHVAILKYAPNGAIVGQSVVQLGTEDFCRSLSIGKGGDIYLEMQSLKSSIRQFATIKFNSVLIESWRKQFNGGVFNIPTNIHADVNTDHSIAVGYAQDSSGKIFLTGVLYDQDGNQLADLKVLGFDDTANDLARVRFGSDGNFYITGRVGTSSHLLRTMKFASNGQLIWTLDSSTGNPAISNIAMGDNGDVFVCGTVATSTPVLVVRYRQVITQDDGPFNVPANGSLNVAAAQGVLANDFYITSDTTINIVSAPAHGSASLLQNGSFSYVPSSNYAGPDSFTYTAKKGAVSSTSMVTLNVQSTLMGLSLSVSSVSGGSSFTGTVTVSAPPSQASGPFTINLAYSSTALHGPATVSIPVASKSATFTVTSDVVDKNETDNITASFNGKTVSAPVTILAAALSNLTFDNASVFGGSTITGTVTLAAAAGPGGATIDLTNSAPHATLSASSVTIPQGSAAGKFTITTTAVSADETGTVTASYRGTTLSRTIKILAPQMSAFTITPSPVAPSATTTGKVTLKGGIPSGGVPVSLTYSAHTSGPSSVTVGTSGTASFTITTKATTTSVTESVIAKAGGTQLSASITITPLALASLSISPTSMYGSYDAKATVTMNLPAPSAGADVKINTTSYLFMPTTVHVAAGAKTAQFTVGSKAVSASLARTFSVTYGSVTKSTSITLKPIAVSSLKISPSIVHGGTASKGYVTLLTKAGTRSVPVTVKSSNSAVASVPTTATAGPGSNQAIFNIMTHAVATTTDVTITVSIGSSTKTAIIRVIP